jgi:glutathione peroxidase
MKLYRIVSLFAVGVIALNLSAFAKDAPKKEATEAKAEKETKAAKKAAKAAKKSETGSMLDYEMETLDGKKINLAEKYKDKVVLLVNVASKCGYTKQYTELEALHEKYGKEGLAVVGVPCNQFGGQEPGSAKEIAEFCEATYGVKFDMLAKVDVKGEDAAPLYKRLTSKKTDPEHSGTIMWNFEKFLIGRDGQVVERFKSKIKPDDPEVIKAIETELAKK